LTIDETIKAVVTIGVNNKLFNILAFKTCKSVEFYFNQNRLTSEQTDYLDKNLLPKVEIDLHKCLSKIGEKQNKRKHDLIEMGSSISAEYAEYTQKIYDISF
jgi:hypothetical protein